MKLYYFLLFIHIVSAILGIGPGFIMTYIVTKATNLTELKHAYFIREKIHKIVMFGGISVLITGLWMGYLNPSLFKQGWYLLSLSLFLISLAFGPFVLKPLLVPIKNLLNVTEGDTIPKQYDHFAKRLFFFEHITNLILFTIIILMILKPF